MDIPLTLQIGPVIPYPGIVQLLPCKFKRNIQVEVDIRPWQAVITKFKVARGVPRDLSAILSIDLGALKSNV